LPKLIVTTDKELIMKQLAMITLLTGVFSATGTQAAEMAFPKTKVSIEKCLSAALKEKAGTVVKAELKIEGKTPVYEFDIETADGKAWDIEVSTITGKVTEVEQEVKNVDDSLFKAKLKVTQEEAKKTALAAFPGEVVETEYEIEADGAASYEFDIKTKDGEIKVEVDATTGKLAEHSQEIYQIGKE
jgi:uncharacterized membrane protein YkoI